MASGRVVVIDDHDLVRIGLQKTLTDSGVEVSGSASTGREGLLLIRRELPDLALVDIRMPDMSGIELCQVVRAEGLPVKLSILTSYVDQDVLHACVLAGVDGYLLKDAPNAELMTSIGQLLEGKSVLDPTITSYAMKWLQEPALSTRKKRGKDALDLRDVEVLRLMAKGCTNPQIGQRLFLSENTIKVLVNDLYRHLNVKGRVEAVMEAHRRGIL
ncbi:response regulator [Alicyclobacillus sp. ALC3]|uniref:response regulator n=1 Tax=Alicyclobacillus sp. ALC3 TaxID=2796143 RepID=UPI0023799912|nr:response regulator transcription factor [Alicyclobacillus sp. ALC3]WDL96267.1 response regulator transcription factor [Alicyclobacillus sp. ALC3]